MQAAPLSAEVDRFSFRGFVKDVCEVDHDRWIHDIDLVKDWIELSF